jgi:hypothetical protein
VLRSYSRLDASIVRPLVQIIRITGSSVFRDEESIRPGKRWCAEIISAIEHCHALLVFWCKHACASDEVQAEYQRAIDLEKDVVPIILDSTPLRADLAEYQAIDLRDVLELHEGGVLAEGKISTDEISTEGIGQYYDDRGG